MNNIRLKELILFFFFSVFITGVFFYKVFLFGQIPFPGDLLTTIAPFKTESYLGYGPSGYPNKAQDPDVLYEIYPWRYFSITELKKGEIPFWNPHNFTGNSQMQNYQTAVFYPLNIFYFLFSFNTAWTLVIISQPILAAFFMYVFLRSYRLQRTPAMIGGIAFAFSSYMTVWMEYGNIDSTILWLPLILFLIKRFIQKQSVINFLILISSLVISFLAGYIQGVFYLYIIAFCYFLFLLFTEKKNEVKSFIIPMSLIFFTPVCLTAFQLIPTITIFLQSSRSPYTLSQISTLLQPIYYWITILAPDFFGNPATRNYWLSMTYIERVIYVSIPLLFFALYAFTKIRKEILFFAIVAVLFLLLTTNLPGVAYVYMIPIPVLTTAVATRALSIFIFAVIVLGAFGMNNWLESNKKEKVLFPGLFLSLYGLVWIALLLIPKMHPEFSGNISITKHNLLIPTVLAIVTCLTFILKRRLGFMTVVILSGLVFFDLFYSFIKITPFSPSSLIYPKTPIVSYLQSHAGLNRFWGYGSAYIPPNFQSIDGTYSPEGNDPLHLKDYGLLLASTSTGKYPNYLPRPDANIVNGYGETDLKRNTARQKILNLLGVKYILNLNNALRDTSVADTSTFPDDIYSLVWQKKPWQIYENKQALPRFFLTSDYIVSPNNKDAITKIYSPLDLSKTLILNKTPQTPVTRNAKGTVKLITYKPNQISFSTSSTGNMLFFLSDNYYPFWAATVDGKETTIYKADMTFRAVTIPAGHHILRMYYNSKSFFIGLLLSGIGIVFVILYSFYLWNKKFKIIRHAKI